MADSQKYEALNSDDLDRITKMREWVIGHYDDPDAYQSVSGKLRVIQTILENKWVEVDETIKLQSLGIAFGDALEQEVHELEWIIVEDEDGRDPALRWRDTSVLTFPQTAISKRLEEGKEVDVYEMFGGFLKILNDAVKEAS